MLAAVGTVLTGLVFGASAAQATVAAVTSVQFENSTFQDQSTQRLQVAWVATASPAENPVTVDFVLPPELVGVVATFDIGNGTCTVTNDAVSCVVDPAYVEANPYNVQGEFEIGVRVDLHNTETQRQTFTIAGQLTNEVEITSRYCPDVCSYGGQYVWKGGHYDNASDNITWTISVPSVAEGVERASDGLSMAPGQTVVVTDTFEGNPFTVLSGPTVQRASCLATDQWGYQVLTGWHEVPADVATVVPNGVQFTTEAGSGCAEDQVQLEGSIYRVQWVVHADDGGLGVTGPGRYHNEATIVIDGVPHAAQGDARRVTYGGTVTGENYGRFVLSKSFDLGAFVGQPDEVTIEYVFDYPGDVPPSESGVLTLTAANGWQFQSDELFRGTQVTLTELNPFPANIDWDASFDLGGDRVEGSSVTFTIDASENVAIDLSNHAEHAQSQSLSASKLLSIDRSEWLSVPAGTAFELVASWPADASLALDAGSVSVLLPADGSRVSLPEIPFGAVVTFAETPPAEVPGATWTNATIAPSHVTIGADTASIVVTATNELTVDVGSFSVSKTLEGDALGLLLDHSFEVEYSWEANTELGIIAGGGVVVVGPDIAPETVIAPAGAMVTLNERLVEIEGGTWVMPVFSENPFAVVEGDHVGIALTNVLELNSGAFSIHKVVDGNAASLVPADAEFTVEYSYPAGSGDHEGEFPAGSGELVVAQGSVVVSPQLPYGAIVTLSEVAPAPVQGATWQTPVFSETTVTIGDDTVVEVTLANTITSPTLPATGVEPGTGIAVLAILLLGAGLAAILFARSRRRN